MLLKIRFKRIGCKHKPFYLLVLANNLMKRQSSLVKMGYYNPQTKVLKYNKILFHKYLNLGAYPTNVVRHLIYKNLV